jgi:DNA polymerase III alpha subunit
MVQVSDKGVPTRPIQEIQPKELQEITVETYSPFKKEFVEKNKEINFKYGNLAEYIQRLEYELKVIKEM